MALQSMMSAVRDGVALSKNAVSDVCKAASYDDDDWYRCPRPVCIAELAGSRLVLNRDDNGQTALKRIMFHKKTKDLDATVICVAGVFRSGKSFLLAQLQRALQQQNCASYDDIHRTLMSLKGTQRLMQWSDGSEPHTQGIVMWSRPITVKRADGKELHFLLVDTQGAWDNTQSQQGTSKLFAFSALLSSVLIKNMEKQINSVDWDHLQFFMQFSNFVVPADSKFHAFQQLILLVRDWQYINEGIGIDGGRSYIEKQFGKKAATPQLRSLFQFLRSSFGDKLQCCLLPTPGDNIVKRDVELRMLKDEFVKEMAKFIHHVIKTAEPKLLGDKPMTFGELYELATDYSAEFANNSDLLDENTLSQSYLAGLLRKSSCDAVKLYVKEIKARSTNCFAYWEDELNNIHMLARAEAIKIHDECCRKLSQMPGTNNKEARHKSMKELDKEFEQIFERFRETNNVLRGKENMNNDSMLKCAIKIYALKFKEVFDMTKYRVSKEQLSTIGAVAEAWAICSASTQGDTVFGAIAGAWAKAILSELVTESSDQFLLGSEKTIADYNEKFRKCIEFANNFFLNPNEERPAMSGWEEFLGSVLQFFSLTSLASMLTMGNKREVAETVVVWQFRQKALFAKSHKPQFYTKNKRRLFKCTSSAAEFINANNN